jgi:hypothetical protein
MKALLLSLCAAAGLALTATPAQAQYRSYYRGGYGYRPYYGSLSRYYGFGYRPYSYYRGYGYQPYWSGYGYRPYYGGYGYRPYYGGYYPYYGRSGFSISTPGFGFYIR